MNKFYLVICFTLLCVGCSDMALKIEKNVFQDEKYDASGTSLNTSVQVEYLTFSDSKGAQAINDTVIKYAFLGYGTGEKLSDAMNVAWENAQSEDTVCVHDEDAVSSESEETYLMSPWYYNCTVECVYSNSKHVSIVIKHSTNSPFVTAVSPQYMTFDIQAGHRIKASDAFADKNEIESMITEFFIKENNLQEGVSLTEQGIGMTSDVIPLTDDFVFSSEGVVFHYPMMQMAPLSQCKDDVKIPFDLLEGQLK
ncbi:MAG: hypothetical protein PHD21_04640 [Flavobacteriales bacterium]|nr:hypothetical protein [Flavobacteriales bacterium]